MQSLEDIKAEAAAAIEGLAMNPLKSEAMACRVKQAVVSK